MYLLTAPDNFPTEKRSILGHEVTDGVVKVGAQYYWHTLIRHGWRDVTPRNWPRSYWKPARMDNVLLMHHSGAGDMLFMTPIIRAFTEKYPDIKVHVATDLQGVIMLIGNPHVSGTFVDADHYIPHYLEDFDDAICFNGMLTKNHESNLINVYDMFADWAGIELPDEQKKPEMYLTASEKQDVEKLLQDKLGWKEGEKLVTIQLSASSPVRSVEEWKMIEVAKKIQADGYKVFVFSYTQLNDCIYAVCEKCDNHEIIPSPRKLVIEKHRCGKCGNIIDIDNKRGIEGIACSDGTTSVRHIAGIIEKASYHIGPDSVGAHLAAAFDVPSLSLFSSFDADLRLRYYPKARWIQKPFPCAPCFSHHMQCGKSVNGAAPCMSQFSVDEIYQEFKRMEAGEPWIKSEPFKSHSDPRPCPVCEVKYHRYINRKGALCYYECLRCGAVYTDQEVPPRYENDTYYEEHLGAMNTGYISGQVGAGKLLHSEYYREDGVNRVLDVGCGVAHTLAKMQELGWEVLGIELTHAAVKKNLELYPQVEVRQENILDMKSDKLFSLVWMNNVLEHIDHPRPMIRKIWELLEDGGVLSIQIPDLAVWKNMYYMGKWGGVNNNYAGEHCVLYNSTTLTWLMQEFGFGDPVVEKHPGPDCLWMSFRKVE